MNPLESAATPGVVKVTSELMEDDALSRGIFENSFRSTSVCAVGSFSTSSEPCSDTVTVVADEATFKTAFTVVVTSERTSTSPVNGPKPLAVTVRW